jgi:hypothetical protein
MGDANNPAKVSSFLASVQVPGKLETKSYGYAAPTTESSNDLKVGDKDYAAFYLDTSTSNSGDATFTFTELGAMDQFGDLAYTPHGTAVLKLVDGDHTSDGPAAPVIVTVNVTF